MPNWMAPSREHWKCENQFLSVKNFCVNEQYDTRAKQNKTTQQKYENEEETFPICFGSTIITATPVVVVVVAMAWPLPSLAQSFRPLSH